jgi:hypothetical protein
MLAVVEMWLLKLLCTSSADGKITVKELGRYLLLYILNVCTFIMQTRLYERGSSPGTD